MGCFLFYSIFKHKIFTAIKFGKLTLLSKKIPFCIAILLRKLLYSIEPCVKAGIPYCRKRLSTANLLVLLVYMNCFF